MTTESSSRRVLQTVGEKLLQHIEREVAEDGEPEVSDEDLLALYSVFGDICERALYLVESQRICLVEVEGNSRRFFKVTGNSVRSSYVLFPDINFCQCPAYGYQVVNSSTGVTCKHVLAVRLAKILKKHRMETVSPQQYAETVSSEISVHFPGLLS